MNYFTVVFSNLQDTYVANYFIELRRFRFVTTIVQKRNGTKIDLTCKGPGCKIRVTDIIPLVIIVPDSTKA